MLDGDTGTQRMVLISKPPHPDVARAILARVAASRKSFTICFLGAGDLELPVNARSAATLRAAAEDSLGSGRIGASFAVEASKPTRNGAIVGLYSGGTLAAEAQLISWPQARVASNVQCPAPDG